MGLEPTTFELEVAIIFPLCTLMTSANKCLEKKFSPRVTVLRYFALKNLGKLQKKIKLNIATSKPADEKDLLNFCLGLEFLTPEKAQTKGKTRTSKQL